MEPLISEANQISSHFERDVKFSLTIITKFVEEKDDPSEEKKEWTHTRKT